MDGIVVSNHGGRQLDYSPAALDMLPGVYAVRQELLPCMCTQAVQLPDTWQVQSGSPAHRASELTTPFTLQQLINARYVQGLLLVNDCNATAAQESWLLLAAAFLCSWTAASGAALMC